MAAVDVKRIRELVDVGALSGAYKIEVDTGVDPGGFTDLATLSAFIGAAGLQASNNLSDLANKKTARSNLGVEARTGQGNANHTFTAADGPVLALTAALSAARTWTLGAASSYNAGARVWVVDEVGGVTVANTLTIAAAGADTIEGGTSVKLATPYGAVCLESDGTSKWTKVAVVSLDQVSHRVGEETGVTSAATTDIGASPTTRVVINGSTGPITSLGTVANKLRIVRLASTPTLTHNATTLVIPGGANVVGEANDRFIAVSDSSGNWLIVSYVRASGKSVIGPALSDITATGALPLVDWTDIASASTTDLGSIASNFIRVTGTVTITGLGTAAATVWRWVRFNASLLLTQSSALLLPGSNNIQTSAGDFGLFKSDGAGNWRCLLYSKATGRILYGEDFETLAGAATTDLATTASIFVTVSGAATITSFGTAAPGITRFLKFSGASVLTHAAALALPAGGANITTANGDIALAHSIGSGNWRILFFQRGTGKPLIGPASSEITDATATGISAITAANAAALATAAGLGTGNSPTFTALTLSGGQIAFPASDNPSAGANTLDDYEENTFSPALAFSTMGDTVFAYSSNTGNYTKIGRQVAAALLILTSTSSHSSGSGAFTVTGLPFAVGSTGGISYGASLRVSGLKGAATAQQWGIQATTAATTMRLFFMVNGATSTATNANATEHVSLDVINLQANVVYFV